MTTTRSQRSMTKRMSCSISRMARPALRWPRMMPAIVSRTTGWTPASGSSSSSRSGCTRSCIDSSSRRCWPIDRFSPASCSRWPNLKSASRPLRARLPVGEAAAQGGEAEIFPHRQLAEDLHFLEGPPDAAPRHLMQLEPAERRAVMQDAAGIGAQQVGDQVEDRALARAVRPDQADHGAGLDLEAAAVDREKTAEPLGQAAHGQSGAGGHRLNPRRSTSSPRPRAAPACSWCPGWRRPPAGRPRPSCRPGPAR